MNKIRRQPPSLKEGDTVGIVSPASVIEKKAVEEAVKILTSWKLNVTIGKHTLSQYHQFAGNDVQRASDFNRMIGDESIKAIWCARGGYGCIRIADDIQFKALAENPKWLVGFSDVTIFHSLLHENYDMQTIHGMMPLNLIGLKDINPLNKLKDILFGEKPQYRIASHPLNKTGSAEGILTGGNLSLLYSLFGTRYDFDATDKIIFIEDIGEKYYHIDRMMQSFKLTGKLDQLKALIVGGMNEMTDSKRPFGKNAEEIISEVVSSYNYPVIFRFPAGHIEENYPLILGSNIKIDINHHESLVEFI